VLKLIRTENGELGVKPAAHMISLIGYSNRNVLQSSIMVAGHDSRDGFNIVAIPMGGAKIENLNFYVTGSGGDLANSYVTANWTPNLTYAQAKEIASSGKNFCSIYMPKFLAVLLLVITKNSRLAIAMAMRYDESSGGCCRLVNVTENGAEEFWITPDQLPFAQR
jgi:20S proteasome subunit beta 1